MGKDHDRAMRRMTREEVMEETKRQSLRALAKVLPFGAQIVASAAAYSIGITATQLVGFVLKVSCATPVLGPTMGLVGVGLANALAGQASKHTRKMVVTKSHPLQPGFWEMPEPEDVLLDAFMGACIFKALGGRFNSVMPSDLAKPGALAFESIPARVDNSEAYAQPSVKRELARIFKRDGCHHCGSRRAPVIGDHMPPNKMLQGSREQLGKWVTDVPVVGKVIEVFAGGRRRGPAQRFYPQCQRCSIKQAAAVRSGRRVLVLHLRFRPRAEHMAGVFVGLRYNAPDLAGGSNGDARRHKGKWASLTLANGPMDGARMDMREPGAFSLQQLPLEHELSSSSLHRGWVTSTTPGASPTYMHTSPLLDHSTGAVGAAWQQQALVPGARAGGNSSPQGGALYAAAANGAAAAAAMPGYSAQGSPGLKGAASEGSGKVVGGGSKGAGLLGQQQQGQQRLLGGSGPGDEAARLPDQNTVNPNEAAGAALMVSLEGWAAAPGRQGRTPADATMQPERVAARAAAAFERFNPSQMTY